MPILRLRSESSSERRACGPDGSQVHIVHALWSTASPVDHEEASTGGRPLRHTRVSRTARPRTMVSNGITVGTGRFRLALRSTTTDPPFKRRVVAVVTPTCFESRQTKVPQQSTDTEQSLPIGLWLPYVSCPSILTALFDGI